MIITYFWYCVVLSVQEMQHRRAVSAWVLYFVISLCVSYCQVTSSLSSSRSRSVHSYTLSLSRSLFSRSLASVSLTTVSTTASTTTSRTTSLTTSTTTSATTSNSLSSSLQNLSVTFSLSDLSSSNSKSLTKTLRQSLSKSVTASHSASHSTSRTASLSSSLSASFFAMSRSLSESHTFSNSTSATYSVAVTSLTSSDSTTAALTSSATHTLSSSHSVSRTSVSSTRSSSSWMSVSASLSLSPTNTQTHSILQSVSLTVSATRTTSMSCTLTLSHGSSHSPSISHSSTRITVTKSSSTSVSDTGSRLFTFSASLIVSYSETDERSLSREFSKSACVTTTPSRSALSVTRSGTKSTSKSASASTAWSTTDTRTTATGTVFATSSSLTGTFGPVSNSRSSTPGQTASDTPKVVEESCALASLSTVFLSTSLVELRSRTLAEFDSVMMNAGVFSVSVASPVSIVCDGASPGDSTFCRWLPFQASVLSVRARSAVFFFSSGPQQAAALGGLSSWKCECLAPPAALLCNVTEGLAGVPFRLQGSQRLPQDESKRRAAVALIAFWVLATVLSPIVDGNGCGGGNSMSHVYVPIIALRSLRGDPVLSALPVFLPESSLDASWASRTLFPFRSEVESGLHPSDALALSMCFVAAVLSALCVAAAALCRGVGLTLRQALATTRFVSLTTLCVDSVVVGLVFGAYSTLAQQDVLATHVRNFSESSILAATWSAIAIVLVLVFWRSWCSSRISSMALHGASVFAVDGVALHFYEYPMMRQRRLVLGRFVSQMGTALRERGVKECIDVLLADAPLSAFFMFIMFPQGTFTRTLQRGLVDTLAVNVKPTRAWWPLCHTVLLIAVALLAAAGGRLVRSADGTVSDAAVGSVLFLWAVAMLAFRPWLCTCDCIADAMFLFSLSVYYFKFVGGEEGTTAILICGSCFCVFSVLQRLSANVRRRWWESSRPVQTVQWSLQKEALEATFLQL